MKFKLSIEESCTENWKKMEKGTDSRFCQKCNSDVKDFTGMNEEEIFRFIKKNKDDKICGRFNPSQLGIVEFNENIISENHSHKNYLRFSPAVALTIAAITLASCNNNELAPADINKVQKENILRSELENPNISLLKKADSLLRVKEDSLRKKKADKHNITHKPPILGGLRIEKYNENDLNGLVEKRILCD